MESDEPISVQWQRLRAQPFPRDTSWQALPECYLPLTDTFAAGCITAFLENEPPGLDEERLEALCGCQQMLDTALASGKLQGESLTYFTLLGEIVTRVLAECDTP